MPGDSKPDPDPCDEACPLGSLDFSKDSTVALNKVYDFVCQEINCVLQYYEKAAKRRKTIASWTRLLIIWFGSTAALIPLIQQIFETSANEKSILFSRGWTPVFLAISAALLQADRFVGNSTAWMRFREAIEEIKGIRNRFQLDWNDNQSTWTNGPTPKQISILPPINRTVG